jgi:glycosyltransferase involved in cell wall biosynthesis
MNEGRIIALLGRRDEPTDAVEEYCRYLGGALHSRGYSLELARVGWAERGWDVALRELRQRARDWRGRWVLLQYTALAWSARGFPLRFLRVLGELRRAGARIGVVYHDVEATSGGRLIDKMRRHAQLRVMRRALGDADIAVFTVAIRVISWLRDPPPKAVFIPVGANLPVVADLSVKSGLRGPRSIRITVFGITGGGAGRDEVERLANAIGFAAARGCRVELHVFGRGAAERETELRERLKDTPVQIRVEGVLAPEQVVKAFIASDVALFVRGVISSRRGSAIAGIACGLPVIAYEGAETAAPITDAGLLLVSPKNKAELGEALFRLSSDADLQATLAERSRRAQKEHFAWDAIASRYVEVLHRQE